MGAQVPSVIDPVAQIPAPGRVTSLAMDPEGGWLAFGASDGQVHLHRLPDGAAHGAFPIEGGVAQLATDWHGQLVVGSHAGDLYGASPAGQLRWRHPLGGGCDILAVAPQGDLITCIDGARTLHAVDSQGHRLWQWSSGELVRLAIEPHGGAMAVADASGTVTVLDRAGQITFIRRPRAVGDERVVALGYTADGHLLISRESLVVAQGADDEHELEWWSSVGQEVHRNGLPARCDVICGDAASVHIGLFSGVVMRFDATREPHPIHRARYAISRLKPLKDDLLVGAWFHLMRLSIRGEELWQVEHSGIVDHIVMDRLGRIAAIAGDDRNEHQAEHLILVLDPAAEARYLDEEGLHDIDDDLRAFAEMDVAQPDAQRISDASAYEHGTDELAGLLTAEELASFKVPQAAVTGASDDLMAMLESDVDDMLGGPAGESTGGTGDLLGAMRAEDVAMSNLPPVCDAGDDQRVLSDETGVAIVLLDGSRSYDPDGEIVGWTWKDQYGRAIGTTDKVRLRLPVGSHAFELTVTDDGGASTIDRTSVVVIVG